MEERSSLSFQLSAPREVATTFWALDILFLRSFAQDWALSLQPSTLPGLGKSVLLMSLFFVRLPCVRRIRRQGCQGCNWPRSILTTSFVVDILVFDSIIGDHSKISFGGEATAHTRAPNRADDVGGNRIRSRYEDD